ncbi:MAG: hypothetical protein HYS12_01335 [Planctomycetes bacterium]|nr:hypothetical protein [Planctomycetota bacterium]
MDELFAELDGAAPASTLLGYLNFSDGRPDPRWQKQLHDAFAFLADRGAAHPWDALRRWLASRLETLHTGGSAAFRDVAQARTVLDLFAQVLPAYREHHADLLAHQTEDDLFQPFFLVRVFEAILTQLSTSAPGPQIVGEVLTRLNDFVGYRPLPVLETKPRGEPYPHERLRPVPLFLRGAGVARGRYHEVLRMALDLLADTDSDLLQAAHFDLELLDEFALDVRAYDHGHPVNRRLSRLDQPGERDPDELLFEAAAVLAGTVLMAAGISGWGPGAHDSSQTLAVLMPGIARYRDLFYQQLLAKMSGPHADRLRQEQALTRQPFGAARQHLNGYLARHRAVQLQQRYLALLFAEMGYPEASRAEARRIPTPSVRFLSEILSRGSTGHREVEHGRLREAARVLPEIEELIRRGIDCGALADPWNVLGFQGLFPLSPAQEDSLRDPRLDELVQVVEQTFHLYGRASSEAAAAGDKPLVEQLLAGMRRLAAWWDPYATVEVSDMGRVHGAEAAESATHVATALGRWQERGGEADLAFWRRHLDTFRTPKAFALVVDALLRKEDYRAAMALLVNWVGQAEQVPLEEGPHSFHNLALRWLLGVTHDGSRPSALGPRPEKEGGEALGPKAESRKPKADLGLAQKFFDYLEANAEDYWQVPLVAYDDSEMEDQEEEDLFGAAYEDVTYKDSTGGEDEGEVLGARPREEFDLEHDAERLERRLRFLSTVARLWVIAARAATSEESEEGAGRGPELAQGPSRDSGSGALSMPAWLATARENLDRLLALMDALHNHPIPAAQGDYDALVEYDRRRVLKEQLVYAAIGTCLDMTMAVGALTGAALKDEGGRMKDEQEQKSASDSSFIPHPSSLAGWGPFAIRLERALFRGDVAVARTALAEFVERFRDEPLLFTPLSDGGEPRQILRVRVAQSILRVLLFNLPRLGLLRETYELMKTARAMEQNHPPEGRGVTEFGQYFQAGFVEAVENVVTSAGEWGPGFEDAKLAALLERLTAPFLALWVEHSHGVQISSTEGLGDEADWERLRAFVRRYGSGLFHARFMTLANLRGVLHRGVAAYLDYLKREPDPLRPLLLVEDLGRTLSREEAARRLEFVLRCVVENYEEYKDYNATTSQSDYGENLHVLLDFLRLKAGYERHAWEFKPLVLAHEVLARRGRRAAAVLWERSFTQLTGGLARQYLERLAALERSRGVRLNTVGDRLNERFVKPLALDRLKALIEPAMRESRGEVVGWWGSGEGSRTPPHHPTTPPPHPSFARLQEELQAYTATPTGVGLDVPAWLRSLEAEVHRVQASQSTLAVLAEGFYRAPRRTLSLDELKRQLEEWDRR